MGSPDEGAAVRAYGSVNEHQRRSGEPSSGGPPAGPDRRWRRRRDGGGDRAARPGRRPPRSRCARPARTSSTGRSRSASPTAPRTRCAMTSARWPSAAAPSSVSAAIGVGRPDARTCPTHDGERVPLRLPVVACGARLLWAVPGAVTFWGVADEGGVGDVVRGLRERAPAQGRLHDAGRRRAGRCRCTSWPCSRQAELAKGGVAGARLVVVTPEGRRCEMFGRAVGEGVAELLRGARDRGARRHPPGRGSRAAR